MFQYLYWHYVLAPRFLAQLFWNLEQALLQFFSVPLLLKTLFAHWHKDAIAYRGGSFTDYFTTFAWNQISRVIGFIIRLCTLMLWLIAQVTYIALAISLAAIFLLSPLLIVAGVVAGLSLIVS